MDENAEQLSVEQDLRSEVMGQFRTACGPKVIEGWNGVKKVLEEFKSRGPAFNFILKGYHGLVLEIIKCEPYLDAAVQAAAGNKYDETVKL